MNDLIETNGTISFETFKRLKGPVSPSISLKTFAKLEEIHPRSARRLVDKGKIKAHKTGSILRIDLREYEDFKKRNIYRPTSASVAQRMVAEEDAADKNSKGVENE